jgi:hypothetical protein
LADREHLRQRLQEMMADRERDRSLTPFLERAEILLNYGEYGALEEADKMLDVAQKLREKQAPVTRAVVQEAAGAVIENHAPVQADNGNIFQAREIDLRGASFTNIVNQGIRELPPEPTVDIVFVLLAMTNAQAEALASKKAFEGQPDILLQNFAALSAYLEKIGVKNWSSHYGGSPEEWRPRGGSSIAELIEATFGELNASGEFKKLVPKFHDIQALGNGTRASRHLVRDLRRNGCLVIADAISLRHPVLLRAYQRCLLDVFPSTSVLALTPGADALGVIQDMVYGLQVNLQESEFQLRVRDLLENRACQVESDLDSVPHWLVGQLRRIYDVARVDDRPNVLLR